MPLEHVDDPGVFDLALADADLELAGGLAGVAEVDVLDEREEGVVVGLRLRSLEEVARVESQAQPGYGLAELQGDLGIAGEGLGVGQQRHDQALAHGVAGELGEPLDLVGDRRAGRRGVEGQHGHAQRLGQPAETVEPPPGHGVGPIDRPEIEVQRRRDQRGSAAEPLEGRLRVVAGLGRPHVLSVLDQGQLELVELQLGDLPERRLQRLPREAECATGDEHPKILLVPSW